jgi:tetratricopeptide (TPR) repeat protein
VEKAFAFDRTSNLRVIVTQSTYLLQKWLDVLSERDRIVATADRDELMHNAPEAFSGRGPWRFFELVEVSTAPLDSRSGRPEPSRRPGDAEDAEEITQLTLQQLDRSASSVSSAVESLQLASACRERNDVRGAHRALEEAVEFAPDWEAVHYEAGKFWLASDDMERARDAFQRAADLMPTFSAAFSNLGATLGELDQPEAAIAAFSQALLHDPESFTILNNIGVVNREIGRLDESERALMRVTAIAPAFVFGHYNLGHTRFLRGDYAGAQTAYEEGQRRDPEKNRRQGCRLALVRFASGDLDGAERDLWRFADQAPQEEREDLLLEAYEIAQALVRAHPSLMSMQRFIDRITAELTQ